MTYIIVFIVYYTDGDDTLNIWNDKNNQAVQGRVCETLPVVVSAAAVMMSQFCSHNNETSWALSPFHPVKQLLHYRDCGWINNKALSIRVKMTLRSNELMIFFTNKV